jgi:hypothetical protein
MDGQMHVDSKGKGHDSAMVGRWWSLCRVAPHCVGSKTVNFLPVDVFWVTHVKNPDQNLRNFAHCKMLPIRSLPPTQLLCLVVKAQLITHNELEHGLHEHPRLYI